MTIAGRPLPVATVVAMDVNVAGTRQRGRAFFATSLLTSVNPTEIALHFQREFIDAEDKARMALLERALARRTLTVATYPGEGALAELHAYVEAPDVSAAPIFACVLASSAVVEHLLAEPPHVVLETATFQVVGDELTTAAVTAALEAWIRRVFPEALTPFVRLSPWPGAVESKGMTLEILRLFPSVGSLGSDGTAPTVFSPPVDLVAEEFRLSENAA